MFANISTKFKQLFTIQEMIFLFYSFGITQPMLHSESTPQNSTNNRLDYVNAIVF